MKTLFDLFFAVLGRCAVLAALLACAKAGTPSLAEHSDAPHADRASRFRFSLLPKSLQRRPSLDFHVITEVTAEGKRVARPSSEKPVHYLTQPGKFTQMGDNVVAGETPPDVDRLTRAMEAALASSHYMKASPSTPLPGIAVVFNYGSFARFSMEAHDQDQEQILVQLAKAMEEDLDKPFYSGPMVRAEDRSAVELLPIILAHGTEREDILRRATLIGGEKFCRDLAHALKEEAVYRAGRGHLDGLGSFDAASPFNQFMNANENLMMLVEDSFSSCYFVVASAFDYRAMQGGKRVLLWRTKMTVNSAGISMSESLPSLVRAAGPYLGKEMPDAVTLTRQIVRGGKVDVGEPRVVETDVPLAPPAGPPAKP